MDPNYRSRTNTLTTHDSSSRNHHTRHDGICNAADQSFQIAVFVSPESCLFEGVDERAKGQVEGSVWSDTKVICCGACVQNRGGRALENAGFGAVYLILTFVYEC